MKTRDRYGSYGVSTATDAAAGPPWMARARCRELVAAGWADPDLWWPAVQAAESEEVMAAKRQCVWCTVRPDCLRWALEHDERDGIWGGTTPRERRALQRRRVAG